MLSYSKETTDTVTNIIKLELEITTAVLTGHKASDDDKFAEHRKRLKELRTILKLNK
jgi:hypothetical protein